MIDPEHLRSTCTFVGTWLERLSKEQGQQAAVDAASRNIHANVAYLRMTSGDTETIAFLGELREKLIADAMTAARGSG